MSAVAAAGAIPNIFGGFAPFPNTIATALLAYQSEAIGFGFGIKFQYAKRLIGAMTNEAFNGLDASGVGNIIEAHNTELINRMAAQLPKWLDIQQNFIEANVSIEVAKATRTPSAWVEIIQAFINAGGTEIRAQIDSLDSSSKTALLLASPLLAVLYYLSSTGTPQDPTTVTLQNYRIDTQDVGGTVGYIIAEAATTREYSFDIAQTEFLLEQKTIQLNNLNDANTGFNFYTSVANPVGTSSFNQTEMQNFLQFINTWLEWNAINNFIPPEI